MANSSLLSELFRYKASVDAELLTALSGLGDAGESHAYQSALRVFNHIHIVDEIFAANLQRKDHGYAANWSPETPRLESLASDIRARDAWFVDYVSQADIPHLEEKIDFTFTDGQRGRMSREEMLGHIVTHGGYHRGQIGCLLPEIENTAIRDVFSGYLHRSDPSRRDS